MDIAMVVIAADEGVMPQTREHLAILSLLGVRKGVIVLTKGDLEWKKGLDQEIEGICRGNVSGKCGCGSDQCCGWAWN